MRVLLCIACLLTSCLLPSVYCGEEEGGRSGPWWQKVFELFKKFLSDFQSLLSELKDKIQDATKDIRDWSKELWNGMKEEWFKWINSRDDMSESEKMELIRYVESLKMPEKRD